MKIRTHAVFYYKRDHIFHYFIYTNTKQNINWKACPDTNTKYESNGEALGNLVYTTTPPTHTRVFFLGIISMNEIKILVQIKNWSRSACVLAIVFTYFLFSFFLSSTPSAFDPLGETPVSEIFSQNGKRWVAEPGPTPSPWSIYNIVRHHIAA